MRRTIGSVIEHKRHLLGTDNTDCYISPGDLLPIDVLRTPIRLPSRWSTSGYATRYLAGTELGTAFDLPSWCILINRQINNNFFFCQSLMYCSLLSPLAGNTWVCPLSKHSHTIPRIPEALGYHNITGNCLMTKDNDWWPGSDGCLYPGLTPLSLRTKRSKRWKQVSPFISRTSGFVFRWESQAPLDLLA